MLTYEHFCEYMATKQDEVLKTRPELAMSQGAAIDVMVEKAKREGAMEAIAEIKKMLEECYGRNKITLHNDHLMIIIKHSARHTICELLRDIDELEKKYEV